MSQQKRRRTASGDEVVDECDVLLDTDKEPRNVAAANANPHVVLPAEEAFLREAQQQQQQKEPPPPPPPASGVMS